MRFALIHMSCAGAWAWGEVPERLRAAGHEVVAPDLDLSPGQTPDDHADAVAAALASADDECVLVGHSYGGLVVPLVADRLPGRVRAFFVIDGLMPEPGESAATLRPHSAAARRAAARETGLWLPEADDLPEDWSRRLVGMPISAWEAPVEFTPIDVPGTFVLCLRDPMADQAERARARGWRVIEVDEHHELPLRNPELAARLIQDSL
jgi:pimeloyl-ACP methyl ester carboxylesterase